MNEKFAVSIYYWPKLTAAMYSYFERYLPTICKSGMVCTLACRWFSMFRGKTKLHNNLFFLKDFFYRNDYPTFSIDNCLMLLLDKKQFVKLQLTTNAWFSSSRFLQLYHCKPDKDKPLKRTFSHFKLQNLYASQAKTSNVFRCQNLLSHNNASRVFYKYMFGKCQSNNWSEVYIYLFIVSIWSWKRKKAANGSST